LTRYNICIPRCQIRRNIALVRRNFTVRTHWFHFCSRTRGCSNSNQHPSQQLWKFLYPPHKSQITNTKQKKHTKQKNTRNKNIRNKNTQNKNTRNKNTRNKNTRKTLEIKQKTHKTKTQKHTKQKTRNKKHTKQKHTKQKQQLKQT
jgi:hypothetical protein